jgi:AbrB family looped-hinge helix DNA binding protein
MPVSGYDSGMERSLGFVAVQSRGGAITIPAEARRALRLDAPGAQVEVILRDNDLLLIPHLAVPLERVRADGASPPGPCHNRSLW